jgi:hypothetical protein
MSPEQKPTQSPEASVDKAWQANISHQRTMTKERELEIDWDD